VIPSIKPHHQGGRNTIRRDFPETASQAHRRKRVNCA
jgi:hypothetical protein